MLLDILLIVGGFGLLIWGADRFVAGASSLAENIGVPAILIGLTIVGFGTSAPEIIVSASAAAQGLTAMAVGNAIGSNIANIGLVLGTTALLCPISSATSGTLRKEISVLVLLTPATLLLFLDNRLDQSDGVLLLIGLIAFLAWITRTGMQASKDSALTRELPEDIPGGMSLQASLVWLAIGLAMLIVGANVLVMGAENLARSLGISDLVIGLTIVAVGTSVPELAVSIVSAVKKEYGIAIGNIIGSNIFNLLAVIGVAGVIQPADMEPSVLNLHYPIMIALTLVVLRIAYNPFGKPGFGWPTGIFLLGAFTAYQTMLLSGNL
jgi:cation:H+ antiporter